MDLREHHSTQQRHPWEVARFRFLTQALRDRGLLQSTRSVLDAGSGDAWFANQLTGLLPNDASITCWDAEYTPESMAEITKTISPQISLTPTRPQTPHDLILLLDVLEHVEHDQAFLQELIAESLRPGGWLLFTVPAWQPLFSRHDTWLHHFRRYSPQQARDVLQAAGLKVAESGGLFHSLLAPRLLTVVQEKLLKPQKTLTPAIAWQQGPTVTQVVQAALDVDNFVAKRLSRAGISVPGLSFWALCQRRA